MIDVILLGSGATMPTPDRGTSAIALRCAGRYVLFDCGEGTQVALRREKVSPVKIDLIALTHYHGDHFFGLPGLLQTMNCLKRTDPLYIIGPDGLEEAMYPVLQMAGPVDYDIRLARPGNPFGVAMNACHPNWPKGARLQRFETEHRVPSQGYSFILSRPPKFRPEKAKEFGIPVSMWKQIASDDPIAPIRMHGDILKVDERIIRGADLMGEARRGLHIVISGDTQPCDQLRSHAHKADLLIHDATYGEDLQESEAVRWGHTTFRQAAEIAREAQVGQLWLTHFSQSMKEPTDYLANAQAVFPKTICGYDGLTETLRFEN